ncbi:MAG: ATP phosphoribosyltransferase regulatory subunit [Alphaproteobacteria bacterium]|nr:ATP phosphoribosyltransferase regulatory subunit [Alphaproteobacteria bacterium]MDE2014219.1 ATP phosphoribosyltransferase regulatory subunit [Alphaproteobacteria bacterium]MDE2075408.1 ATP phosphoribosyltransferase regulatory subunit [Alphaproteobacteria bacterium]
MTAFPDYDAARLAALDEQAASILGVFGQHGYVRAEPSVLQPAEIFLDRSGEEIRRRTFAFTDPAGNELCLRPDLTIPICRMYLAGGAGVPARLCYNGLVFRHQPAEPERPTQFYQAGVELLGLEERAAAETEILTVAVQSLRAAGLDDFTVKVGDLGLFSAFVDALDIPPQWRGRLKRHFWRAGYFEALLARLSRGAASDAQRLLAHLGTLGEAEARSAFEGLIDLTGGRPQGARTREEIVDRLMEQAADASALRLDPRLAELVGKLLAVSGPASAALEEIRTLTKAAGVTLTAPLAAMAARLSSLKALGVAENRISFAARFGRNMEYYTGFVFELWAKDAEGPVQVAGGGRYDLLLEHLGAKRPIPAIGFTIRTERVLAARAAKGA